MDVKHRRILLVSDVHQCRFNFFGLPSAVRKEHMTAQLLKEYEEDPYDMILFLGDYSLDFWDRQEGGSYLNETHVSDTANLIRDYLSRLPVPYFMIAGNHEQYGRETWRKITGCDRSLFPGHEGRRLRVHVRPDPRRSRDRRHRGGYHR